MTGAASTRPTVAGRWSNGTTHVMVDVGPDGTCVLSRVWWHGSAWQREGGHVVLDSPFLAAQVIRLVLGATANKDGYPIGRLL